MDLDTSNVQKSECGVSVGAEEQCVLPLRKRDKRKRHRKRIMDVQYPFNVAMARLVGRKEIAATREAQEAEQKEWNRLRERKVWDESDIRDWHEVQAEYQKAGKKVHMAYLFGSCVEKGS